MDLVPSPSQTIGPFFHFCLTADGELGRMAGAGAQGERIRLACRVVDADGAPVSDAMIELWQAAAGGEYNRPGSQFGGFGRLPTDEAGRCVFETVKPGRVPGLQGKLQAPHVNVSLFARGLLNRLVTRIYFAGDPANGEDHVLGLVPADRRETLMAHADGDRWNFEIHLGGECETVFFDV